MFLMPNYLWKARDGSGKMVAVRRPAASVKEAQTQLLQEGFLDLELQTDDIAEAASDLFEEKVEVTPEEDLKFRKTGSFRLTRTLWNGFTDAFLAWTEAYG